MKKILKCIGFILLLAAIMYAVTGILPFILSSIIPNEDDLYSLSGSLGTIAAAITAVLMTSSPGDLTSVKNFSVPKALILMVLCLCVNKILFESFMGSIMCHLLPKEEFTDRAPTIITLLTSIVMAPVAEEFLFRRGIFLFMKREVGKITAYIVSSLLFMICHGIDPETMVGTFTAGLVFAMIFEHTHNIWYSVLVHMGYNIFAKVSNAVTRAGIPMHRDINGYCVNHLYVITIAVVITGVIVFILMKARQHHEEDPGSR